MSEVGLSLGIGPGCIGGGGLMSVVEMGSCNEMR